MFLFIATGARLELLMRNIWRYPICSPTAVEISKLLSEIMNSNSDDYRDYLPDYTKGSIDDMGDLQDACPAVRQLFDKLFRLIGFLHEGKIPTMQELVE